MNKKILLTITYFIIAFVVTQIITFFISNENFLKSPTFILLPIVGFFSLFFVTKPIMKDLKINKVVFLVGFVVLCLLGYYLTLFFYNYNIYVILNNMPLQINFFKSLLKSAFVNFIVSGMFGVVFSK